MPTKKNPTIESCIYLVTRSVLRSVRTQFFKAFHSIFFWQKVFAHRATSVTIHFSMFHFQFSDELSLNDNWLFVRSKTFALARFADDERLVSHSSVECHIQFLHCDKFQTVNAYYALEEIS